MQDGREVETAILRAAARIDLIAGLERAIDASYQRVVHTAATHWQRGVGNIDPGNACVNVHVIDATTGGVIPTAGIFPKGKRSLPMPPGIPSPGFVL